MKKTNLNLRWGSFALIIFIFSIGLPILVYGNTLEPSVSLHIQGFDKTILSKEISGVKFKNALDNGIVGENIKLVYSQNGVNTEIFSIDNIKNNHFNEDDGWSGYILRDNLIIEKDNLLNTNLKDNDLLVIYYGKKDETQIISEIVISYENKLVDFNLVSKKYVNGKSTQGLVKNCTILLTNVLTNENIILVTNLNGKAYIKLDVQGEYTYQIIDERTNTYPLTVRTETSIYNHNV